MNLLQTLFVGLNYPAILLAGLAYMIFGFLWYSPILVGKPWAKLMGYDKMTKEEMKAMQKSSGPAYFASLIASFVQAFVAARLISGIIIKNGTYLDISIYLILIWIGFSATHSITMSMFNKQSLKLWAINAGYQVIGIILMAVIFKLMA